MEQVTSKADWQGTTLDCSYIDVRGMVHMEGKKSKSFWQHILLVWTSSRFDQEDIQIRRQACGNPMLGDELHES